VIRGRVHPYLRGGEHDFLFSLGVSDDGVFLLSVMLIAVPSVVLLTVIMISQSSIFRAVPVTKQESSDLLNSTNPT
jgi:hypothetical protein